MGDGRTTAAKATGVVQGPIRVRTQGEQPTCVGIVGSRGTRNGKKPSASWPEKTQPQEQSMPCGMQGLEREGQARSRAQSSPN